MYTCFNKRADATVYRQRIQYAGNMFYMSSYRLYVVLHTFCIGMITQWLTIHNGDDCSQVAASQPDDLVCIFSFCENDTMTQYIIR